MKKNNQGFMLIEALVMSMIIIGVLVFMYITFQNVSNSYDKSFQYNTVPGLYIANEVRNFIETNNQTENLKGNLDLASSKYYIMVTFPGNDMWTELCSEGKVKTVLMAFEDLTGLKGKRTNGLSETMHDFINYLKVDGKTEQYRILVEFNDNTYASLKIGGTDE